MVAAKDVFAAYAEAPPPLQKTLKDLAPPVAKAPVGAVVGAAAAVGYVLTPSSRLAVNAVGGVLTGTAGFFGWASGWRRSARRRRRRRRRSCSRAGWRT